MLIQKKSLLTRIGVTATALVPVVSFAAIDPSAAVTEIGLGTAVVAALGVATIAVWAGITAIRAGKASMK